jgi:hypothetical protein
LVFLKRIGGARTWLTGAMSVAEARLMDGGVRGFGK